jgi:hypothetical protein
MNRFWTISMRVTTREVTLLVRDEEIGDLLKARLPLSPKHPRALLTLLEGLALWRGRPLRVVLSATGPSIPWLGSDLFGDDLWPGESPLVTFAVVHRGRRRRLEGLGNFRAVRRVAEDEL